MNPKVALIDIKKHKKNSMQEALKLIGSISKLNTPKRDVILKVGVYSGDSNHHTTVEVTSQIIEAFDKARKIYLAESDSYHGTGIERLQIWKKLFSDRVIPYNISDDEDTQSVKINTDVRDLSINLPVKLFKPRVFISTHVLRTYTKGSVLKNLFGLVPIVKKAQFHKNAIFNALLPDMAEAIGGIDFTVLDGSYLHAGPQSSVRVRADVLVVGTDAVAVETIGAKLVGLNPQKSATIQSFVQRGLGVGDFDEIELFGDHFDLLKERVAKAEVKAMEIARDNPPKFLPARSIDKIINAGFFTSTERRTTEEVVKRLEKDDSRAKSERSPILSTLQRRVKMGRIKGEKTSDGWIFWAA